MRKVNLRLFGHKGTQTDRADDLERNLTRHFQKRRDDAPLTPKTLREAIAAANAQPTIDEQIAAEKQKKADLEARLDALDNGD